MPKKKKSLYKRVYKKIYSPIKYISKSIEKIKHRNKLKTHLDEVCALIKDIQKNKKLVYIIQQSFYNKSGTTFFSGGGERYAIDLSNVLKEKGYQVILLQESELKGNIWHLNHKGLDVIGVPSNTSQDVGYLVSYLPKPDLSIYACTADYGKLLHPNIRISHGITWDHIRCDVKDNLELYKSLLEDTDYFVSVDSNTISWFRSSLAKTIHDSKKYLNFIPNYVDLEEFKPIKRPKSDRIKITFPRRCSLERGYWETSTIIPDLLNKYPHVDFEFIGVPCQPEVVSDLKRLHEMFPNRLTYKSVEADKMYEIYQNTDISIIPTIFSEGTSLSCLEAMATGNAIISTNVGGLTNLVLQGFNGILINPSSEELFSSLCKVIENNELREELSKNALISSKAFSKKLWEERWNEVLDKALVGEK